MATEGEINLFKMVPNDDTENAILVYPFDDQHIRQFYFWYGDLNWAVREL